MPLPEMTISDLEGDVSNTLGIPPLITPPFDTSPVNQVIQLLDGWSMVSSYIDTTQLTNWDYVNYPQTYTPPNNNLYKISDIFEQFLYRIGPGGFEYHVYSVNQFEFAEAIIIAKDNNGVAWLPEWNFDGMKGLMLGNIAGIFQGFQIKMNGDGYYLKLQGIPALLTNATSIDYPVRNGWNIIGYPYTEAISAVDFFEELLANNHLVIAKDYLGNAYLPEWDYNGLGNLVPGQGYQIKLQNWVNDATFSARISNGTILVDTEVVESNENEDVVVIEDVVEVTDTNLIIDIQNHFLEPLIEYFDIKKVLDEKITILRNFYNPSSESKNLDGLAVQAIQISNEFVPKSETNNKEEAKTFFSPFNEELNFYLNNYAIKKEPSGYSLETQRFVNAAWEANRLKKNVFGVVLREQLYIDLYKDNLNIEFIAFNSNKNKVCGRLNIKINKGKYENAYALTIKGDDTTTTNTIEGLVANETPQIFLFNSEKYNLCNFTLNNQTLNFVDKKYITPTGLTLVQPPVLNPKS